MRFVTPGLGIGVNPDKALATSEWLNTNQHECNWEHINCTMDTKQVQGLQLYNLGLTGQISSEVALLTNLVFIDFSENLFLDGTIPSALWSMQ